MATFFMFGRYSNQALKGVSAVRTRKAEHLISRFRGRVISMYALLGEDDLVLVVTLPTLEDAMKVSTGLNKLTGIAFRTVPALSVSEFDKIMTEV